MDINDKKFTRTKKIINLCISLTLAVFLILLSNTIIDDLDSTINKPEYTEFSNTELDEKYNDELNGYQTELNLEEEALENIQKMIQTANVHKYAEQESFDNWIKTRSTLGKAEQDVEVLKRLAKLDEYKQVVLS